MIAYNTNIYAVYVNQKETDVRTDRVFDLTVNLLKPGDWFGVSIYQVHRNTLIFLIRKEEYCTERNIM